MPDKRSASQVLFGYLPNQTVDLRGAVWKVSEWRNAIRDSAIDLVTLKRELRRAAGPWSVKQRDGGYVADLAQGRDVHVMRLDRNNGVDLEPFPRVWYCADKECRRVLTSLDQKCSCGSQASPLQFHFVGYCSECGTLKTPYIPRCAQHQQVKVSFPGTASAAEIIFSCPICATVVRKGFGFPPCDCGRGKLQFNVHRASSVYTPRSIVVVNPPSPERLRALTAAGGPPRALAWVLDGMDKRSFSESDLTGETLREQLTAQGLPEQAIEAMIRVAEQSGGLKSTPLDLSTIPPAALEQARSDAVTITLACSESRLRVSDLVHGTDPKSDNGILYRQEYPARMQAAGIHSVELCDRFPVLTGMLGYTRGPTTPGESRLVPFREKNGTYRVYADVAETEAFFVRLAPCQVADWLRARGANLDGYTDDFGARVSIVKACSIPDSTGTGGDDAGTNLLTLVHSFAHRFIRLTAVHAGIDRNALSELLVPSHLGFYVYAAARGFVLGGLQAVFEGELDRLLNDFTTGEHRCALDPGCRAGGGACMACLHLGEPSCRYYNQYLDRNVLTGVAGFL